MIGNRLFTFASILVTSVCAAPVFALSSDSDQPISLEADRVEIDDSQGISTYTGNVKLKQGSTRISGDKIIIYSGKKGLEKLTAFGKPAIFQQRPDGESRDVTAKAETMEHRVDIQNLVLTGNAMLDKGKDQFSGAKLEYDMKKNIIRASSVKSASGADKKQRVKMVIQPSTLPAQKPASEKK